MTKAGSKVRVKKPTKRAGKAQPTPRRPKRADDNPFRDSKAGGGYALVYDLLSAHPDGINRHDLVRQYARLSGKPEKTKARWDVAVCLSARPDKRHPSCKGSFTIAKEHDFVRLVRHPQSEKL